MQETLNQSDIRSIKGKILRSYFELSRIYLPFLVTLVVAYYVAKNRLRGPRMRGSKDITDFDYNLIYFIVFTLFFVVFLIFFLRDYRRKVAPYRKEMHGGAKSISTFRARKYFDPIYNQYLLYHPTKENTYILLNEYEFSIISEGQELILESGTNTGIVLAIKINDKTLSNVEEFKFSQQ